MSKLKKLLACLKELNFKPNVNNFEHRLIIQKTACLLELMGFKIGYNFSLYVRGPYSTDLTHDLYDNIQFVYENKISPNFSSPKREKLLEFSDATDKLDPALLEIMSTYAFISKALGKDEKEAIIELKRLKPFFSDAQIAVGVSRAKQLITPTEDEVKRMKKEFEDFEGAGVSDMQ